MEKKKDFKKWHGKKSSIDVIEKRPFFHEREIWFCYLGANIGYEQDGSGEDFLRPVLILRKFNNEIFWGVPLTKSKKKRSSPFYYCFSFLDGLESAAVLSQMRLIDARRLSRKIGDMEELKFRDLIEKLKALLP